MFNIEKQYESMIGRIELKQNQQFNTIVNRLDTIISLLSNIINKENTLMATLQNVTDAVAAESTVDDSIITLLNGIVQQLKDAQASGDPAALDAVVAGIQANTAKIQSAVTANTPAAPVA